MLILQEVNRVRGSSVTAFEKLTQQWWGEVEPLGVTPAWFFEVSHGTGPSYRVVTGVRIPDWSTWESLGRAMAYGELAATSERLDATRYESESALLEVRVASGVGEWAAGGTHAPDESGLWVLRSFAVGAPARHVGGPDGTVIELWGCVGSLRDQSVILSREAPGAVLDVLTDRADPAGADVRRPVGGPAVSTWVLRPAAWSPLQ
ncbi:MAG: hypothetical protein ACYCU7_05705 [Acidimicrobiales bacterium]